MTDTGPARTISISKTVDLNGRKILDTAAEIEISADPKTLAALTGDTPLDTSQNPVRLTVVKPGVRKGSRSIDFSGNKGTVSFSEATGTDAGLGVYTKLSDLSADLAKFGRKENRPIPFDRVSFPDGPAAQYYVFSWTYNRDDSVDGSVPLIPGAEFQYGTQDTGNGSFSIIRAYAVDPPPMSAIRDLFGPSWILPGQVRSAEDLQPGTWILSEVSGGFRANLNVDLGFNYNWIRSVRVLGDEVFEGDIGLKMQSGTEAAFGLNAEGHFLLIVGRDSLEPEDKVVRVRLHRLDLHDRNAAFKAGLKLKASPKIPKLFHPEDFLAAILGVHGLQILEEVRQWADPNRSRSDLAAALLADFVKIQLGEEFEQKFEEIRLMVVDWFKKWDRLPGNAASALWDAVRLDQKSMEKFVGHIRKLADPKTTEKELQALMSELSSVPTPIRAWLLGIIETRILHVIINTPETARVREAAQTTLAILKTGMLDTLRAYIETRAGFPKIRKAVEENDFESLTALAQKKLAQFLGKNAPLEAEDISKVRKVVHQLLSRGEDLYRAGIEALGETCSSSFDFVYSKTALKTALIDVCFDFRTNPNLQKELAKAVAGDFTAILPAPGQSPPKGITFNEAILTHRLQRQAHVRINLPYLTSETMHQASSLAGYELLNEQGNIHLYSLDAEDKIRRENMWQSSLGICLNLALGKGTEIRIHDRDPSGSSIDFHFLQAIPDLHATQLERFLNPISELYFEKQHEGVEKANKLAVHEWVAALRQSAGSRESRKTGLIGNSLIKLDVWLPGRMLLKWLQAPEDKKDSVYMDMSRRIQFLLRRIVPVLYFQDAEKYRDLNVAWPLLVYASLPVSTSMKFENGALALNTDTDLYWNWPDARGIRRHLVASDRTAEKLTQTLNEIAALLSKLPNQRSYSGYYEPATKLDTILSSISGNPGKFLLESMLYSEATIIEAALRAGRNIHRFGAGTVRVPEAVQALACFGMTLTQTFHAKMATLFDPTDPAGKHILRILGLFMFTEITRALDPKTGTHPTAALEITVLKSDGPFPPKGFPERMDTEAESIIAHSSIPPAVGFDNTEI